MGQRRRNQHRRSGDVVSDSSSDDSSIRLASPDVPRPARIHSAPLGGSESGAPPTTHARISRGLVLAADFVRESAGFTGRIAGSGEGESRIQWGQRQDCAGHCAVGDAPSSEGPPHTRPAGHSGRARAPYAKRRWCLVNDARDRTVRCDDVLTTLIRTSGGLARATLGA